VYKRGHPTLNKDIMSRMNPKKSDKISERVETAWTIYIGEAKAVG